MGASASVGKGLLSLVLLQIASEAVTFRQWMEEVKTTKGSGKRGEEKKI